MRLARTAGGGFINVGNIERLVDERGSAADGLGRAICADGEEIGWPRITARQAAPSASCNASRPRAPTLPSAFPRLVLDQRRAVGTGGRTIGARLRSHVADI